MNTKVTKRQAADYGKVAVLLGGNSTERLVSLNSGEAIYKALRACGIDAIKIDPTEGIYEALTEHQIERAFIALHGRDGEDGVIQGFLQTLGIPYCGSDVASSALAMNKMMTKLVWQKMGVPTADFVSLKLADSLCENKARRVIAKMGPTVFVKPAREGSSVGMSKVTSAAGLIDAVELAHRYDSTALVERYIKGKEYTVAIIDGKALPSISMQTPRDFYDYEAKYQASTTEYFCPSGLSEAEEKVIGAQALQAFSLLGCSGWGRVDFIRDDYNGEFLTLEVNTVPGMTETSLVPKAAAAFGISFNDLVLQILDTSFNAKEASHG